MTPLLNQNPLAAGQAGDAAEAAPAPAAVDPDYRAKATEAAIKFESFFIGHMLHQMRSSTREMAGPDSVFKDPINSDMLDMADNLVADKMAGQRAFGIADAILRQLLPPAQPAPGAPVQNFAKPLNVS
ncbi:rod-binding protein [Rugamonas sp. CCM 8940]|uniref:rod-binding protein n=1 Tax=Rugamonas sp. CCM 8940 TaxID=2765359 RepID=UPI0018F3C7BB|nr:rod-binding protein [Rugamonas sp. CCM 8940]MBJ7310707.1 rod-binding protein [Rugamonas sp. CCM 8940]